MEKSLNSVMEKSLICLSCGGLIVSLANAVGIYVCGISLWVTVKFVGPPPGCAGMEKNSLVSSVSPLEAAVVVFVSRGR